MSGSTYRFIAMTVAIVLAAALVVEAVVLLVRSDDNSPIQVVIPTPDTGLSDSATPSSLPNSDLKVYLSGAVRNPGVYQVEQGDRLIDALNAAGGAKEDALLDLVNLSLRVVDQGHYHIPRPGETPPPGSALSVPAPLAPSASQGSAASTLVNLNLAPAEVLETLPGIGPILAQAIVDYREGHGDFQSVEEITNVSRIGPITFQKIRDLVTVGASP